MGGAAVERQLELLDRLIGQISIRPTDVFDSSSGNAGGSNFFQQSFQTVVDDECLLRQNTRKTVLLFKAFKHGCVQKLIGIKKMRH